MENQTAPAAPVAASPTPAPNPPPAPAAAPLPVAPAPGEEWRAMTPEQFKARLEEQRQAGERAVLKALGVEKSGDAKAIIEKAREAEQARMSELERAQARIVELEGKAKAADTHAGIVNQYAAQEFAALPEPMQKYIADVAGEDPAARLKAITAARASGVLQALTQSAAPAAPAPRPANPATTMAPPGPSQPPPEAPMTAYQQHQQYLKGGNKILAARYAAENARAIETSRPKQ